MKQRLKTIVPEYIRNLKPYEPGKPLAEIERELGIKRSVKMASNENPLGPSSKAIKALEKTAKCANVYPDGGCFYLREKLAKKLGVRPGELVFGNGSNEIIELLLRCFVKPGDNIVVSQHSFLMYKITAEGMGAKIREAPAKNLGHDLEAMAGMINDETRLVFIANPNNPTGSYVDKRQLTKFLSAVPKIPIAVDEAYFEYVEARDYPDTPALRKRFSNLVTLRTFSKAYGLAGLRVGYGIGNSDLIDYLNRVRQPFNVNSSAQAAALAALTDADHIKKSLTLNRIGKKQIFESLAEMGIDFLPTEGNFILLKVGRGRKVFEDLLLRGVVVRPMDVYGLPEYIRVTIGKKEDNRKFLTELTALLGKG